MQVLILGGGVMGAATACFLARDHGIEAVILERDPTYRRASSALSASSIRVQFSTAVNIALSRWSLSFLRRVGDELAVGSDRPAIGLVEPGYLYLASRDDPAAAARLHAAQALQEREGADVALLTPHGLRQRFGWLHTADLSAGSLGLSTSGSGEGWFDGPALAAAFRRKAVARGARFVAGEAVRFETRADSVTAVLTADGRRWSADAVVLAAGAWTAPLAAALGVALPVVARKRDVFVVDSPAALPGCPLVIDPSGVWFRPEGRGFITGSPPRGGDPDEPPLEDIDHGLFDDFIWPVLAHRVPAFEALRVRSAWAGYYEMNTADHNGLAGPLPGWRNAWTACGFSGHGMQQAPAVGAGLAAQVAGGLGRTGIDSAPCAAPDLTALAPVRLRTGALVVEDHVI